MIGFEADYSLDSIAFLLAAWAERLIVALVPRDTDPEPYLAAACAVGNFAFPASGSPVWTPRPNHAGHPLLDQLNSTDDAGIIIFTSGSTGRAKAALHSVERFLHNSTARDEP